LDQGKGAQQQPRAVTQPPASRSSADEKPLSYTGRAMRDSAHALPPSPQPLSPQPVAPLFEHGSTGKKCGATVAECNALHDFLFTHPFSPQIDVFLPRCSVNLCKPMLHSITHSISSSTWNRARDSHQLAPPPSGRHYASRFPALFRMPT
jgi:hypothetical protein